MQKSVTINGLIWAALLTGLLIFDPSLSQGQSSTGYALKAYALSGGGELAASTHYTLTSTLGQAGPVGISFSDHYVHHAGFWYAVNLKKMLFLPLILKE